VADAGRTMQEIVGSVQGVNDMIGEITSAATQQLEGIDRVNAAVGELDHMTQQNSALVQQSAAAAEALKSQANKLSDMVGVFHIEAQGAAARQPVH
jgi:methyl-accepting chemotaxis protein